MVDLSVVEMQAKLDQTLTLNHLSNLLIPLAIVHSLSCSTIFGPLHELLWYYIYVPMCVCSIIAKPVAWSCLVIFGFLSTHLSLTCCIYTLKKPIFRSNTCYKKALWMNNSIRQPNRLKNSWKYKKNRFWILILQNHLPRAYRLYIYTALKISIIRALAFIDGQFVASRT